MHVYTLPIAPIVVPKRSGSPVKSEESSSTSVSLTSSSSLSKDVLSTTTDDQSILSEGCWIRSRSEGQIVTNAMPKGDVFFIIIFSNKFF